MSRWCLIASIIASLMLMNHARSFWACLVSLLCLSMLACYAVHDAVVLTCFKTCHPPLQIVFRHSVPMVSIVVHGYLWSTTSTTTLVLLRSLSLYKQLAYPQIDGQPLWHGHINLVTLSSLGCRLEKLVVRDQGHGQLSVDECLLQPVQSAENGALRCLLRCSCSDHTSKTVAESQ